MVKLNSYGLVSDFLTKSDKSVFKASPIAFIDKDLVLPRYSQFFE